MKQYLLSVYQPDGPPPASVDLAEITRDVNALADEMKAAGAWVFSDGLFPPTTATVVRLQDGEMLTTDGPYVEGKEHLGGLTIIQAPDLDAALEWGRKCARATTLPIEVRPFQRDVS
ncbi:MAG TPA: YciI family protein [Acidimicrobiales bacterium]|jgi:hypothetical protein|nr:YciI family protein [Acidimicrobiales bacterium]